MLTKQKVRKSGVFSGSLEVSWYLPFRISLFQHANRRNQYSNHFARMIFYLLADHPSYAVKHR